jgi:quercetin dioxygenase-like cupin family protein
VEVPPPSPPARVLAAAEAEVRWAPSGKASLTGGVNGANAFVATLGMAPGAEVPSHRDHTEEYIHVLAGSGSITIDGVEHAIGPGDTVFMPAEAEVSYVNGTEPFTALQVFAGPEPADKYRTWTPEPPPQ